jgi:uncharacterized protein (TIGR00297 family)
MDTNNLITGSLLAAAGALGAWRAVLLSRSGMLAAFILGALVFGMGGLEWALLLLGFFISSSALSRYKHRRKAVFDEKFSKGSRRDAAQVLANGGVCGLFVLLHLFYPQALWPWLGFAGSLAAANADTWATELGVLSRTPPRLLTTLRQVERGTSGGVSLAGTLAALAGALFIALLMLLFTPGPLPKPGWEGLLLVTAAGLAGSLLDSLLGATWQGIYTCPACQKETERHPLHTCGTATLPLRGWRWLDNDAVNTACTLGGGLLAAMLALQVFP